MIRPASTTTLSGACAESPAAMTSALTNSAMPSLPPMSRGSEVEFPAPFGPAMTTRSGTLGQENVTDPDCVKTPEEARHTPIHLNANSQHAT